MELRNTTIFAAAMLLPALGLAQAIKKPPVPPVAPATQGATPQQQLHAAAPRDAVGGRPAGA